MKVGRGMRSCRILEKKNRVTMYLYNTHVFTHRYYIHTCAHTCKPNLVAESAGLSRPRLERERVVVERGWELIRSAIVE
jgi:hypothetical protein